MNTISVNILKKFTMILLDIITTRTNVHIPKTATGRDSTATIALNAS